MIDSTEILKDIIKDNPIYTIGDIKQHIYVNNRYWSQFYLEPLDNTSTNPKKLYDSIFGAPVDKHYNHNYIKLIQVILGEYPEISQAELELEFEFRQPIWGENLLIVFMSLSPICFLKDSRFLEKLTGRFLSFLSFLLTIFSKLRCSRSIDSCRSFILLAWCLYLSKSPV